MPTNSASTQNGALLASLFDAAEEGFVGIDSSGVILYANAAALAMLGAHETDVVGRPFMSIGIIELTSKIDRCVQGACPGSTFGVDIGERQLACRVWSSPGGGVAVTIRDDAALVGRRERIEAVLAASTDGLIVLSPEDEVTYVNPSVPRLLGMSHEDLVGRTVSVDALLGVEPMESEPAPCWEVMDCELTECPAFGTEDLRCWLMDGTLCSNETPQSFSAKRERCAQCEVWERDSEAFDALADEGFTEIELGPPENHSVVKVRVNPVIGEDGTYLGRVIVMHDITHEHEIAQMKNEFVSTVSHELRTPLTSIKGYVDLILDGDAGDINDIQREFLTIVKENSDRLVALINDMLDISRIESGRIHFKVEPLSIAESIQGAVDTFRGVLEQTGRVVNVDVPDDLPLVAADRDRIGQVLINFISNALKYSPDGGNVDVSALREDGLVTVEVSDRGLGVSREDQKLLFTKFYRVDSAITREIGGTGLGLSICKSIVELLGGRIGCTSTLGEGSTFWFSLPIAPPDLIRTPITSVPDGAKGTVLVIDKDPEIALLIETYLRKQGFDVVKAYTAESALAKALRVHPQVITLDVILDEGDGFELLQQLKEHPDTRDTPVVVLSIVCDEGRSCRFGAANYLEKPIDQKRLLDVIGNLVGSENSPHVLVVDDEHVVVEMLGETLRRRGFAVTSAYDGHEAIAAIEQRVPDIVLLDLRMPRMDGYEVIKAIKTHPEWRSIPIVVMTAHRVDGERTDLLELTAAQIAKPMSPADIAAKVDAVLMSRTAEGV